MATLKIQNRTRNPYKIPLSMGEVDLASRLIAPGMTGEIEAEKHAKLMKGNRAYVAMLDQRKLIVNYSDVEDVSNEELENTSDPERPADLLEDPEAQGAENNIAATVESKGIEVVEAPQDELSPAQKGAATRAAKKSAPPAQK